MKFKVYGGGCLKCDKTIKRLNKVLQEEGSQAEVQHINDLDKIASQGVLLTPAVYLDDELIHQGRVPRESEIREWLKKGALKKGAY